MTTSRFLLLMILFSLYWKFIIAKDSCTLLSFARCKHPEPPLDKELKGKVKEDVEFYTKDGRIKVRGNVTVLQNLRGINAVFKSGAEKKNSKRLFYNHIFDKMTCNSAIAKLVLNAISVRYDPHSCEVYKGNYVFDNLDVAKLESATNYVPIRISGVRVWYFGFYGPAGTYACYDMRMKLN